MAVNISIKTDVRAVSMMLTNAAKKQIPFAERQAVNALAFEVMRAEREATTEIFKIAETVHTESLRGQQGHGRQAVGSRLDAA